MKDKIESRISNYFHQLGINVSWVTDRDIDPHMYVNCLRGAIAVKKPLNIVQVGANDGKNNDPIYEFVKKNKDSTNIILVEPVKSVIPYLIDNYSYHPSHEVVNKAVGRRPTTVVQLYGIKKEFWDKIDVSYGDDWPKYRIPTGVTTNDRDSMLRWIEKNINSPIDPKDIIKVQNVETISPEELLVNSSIMNKIQLLQVETEGMDAEIVYSFLESNIYPNIINIESKHLSKIEKNRYKQKLNKQGYTLYDYTPDETIAIARKHHG